MGGPDEPSTKSIDASVGGLVWVRRRNGSWWPGRIMGLNEVSESCLVSPRSGTPVKLLGRDDASVDWYNLEKSKRVKAFRCGEYDDCIEKAKASAANSSKKAVKYARREDAILHALEIESARLGKDHPDFFSRRRENSCDGHGSSPGESPTMSNYSKENEDMTDDTSDSENESGSAPELSQSVISFEEPNNGAASKVQPMQGKRRRTPNDSEDDGTEGIKRMRGLEDLGIGIVSKAKVQAVGVPEPVQHDNTPLCGSNTGNCFPNGNPVNGNKCSSSSLKRKRTQVANVHEFLKRKNRRRPLTKVLESTAMVSVPVVCDQFASSNDSPLPGLSDSKVSGIDSNESKKRFPAVINNNSDSTGVSCENGISLNAPENVADASQISNKVKENEISSISGLAENDSSDRLFDVPFVGEDKHSAGLSSAFVSSSSGKPQVDLWGRQSSQSSQAEAISLKNEGLHESGSTSSAAVDVDNSSERIEKDTSKWQLKRKRNSRKRRRSRKEELRKHVDMDDKPNDFLTGIEQMDGFPHSLKKVDCNGVGSSLASYGCALQAKSKPVAEDPMDRLEGLKKSVCHKENHTKGPKVEAKLLPDGSLTTQRLLPYRQSRFTVHPRYQMSDFPKRNSSLYDVKLEVKASYRPPHVPLVSLMSKLDGKAIIGHPLTVEVLDSGCCDLMISSKECKGANVPTEAAGVTLSVKRNSEAGRVPTKHMKLHSRFPSKKSSKTRKSTSLSKKIRKLSSLTGQKLSEGQKLEVEKPKEPVVACIPLKLVFSRINEAVNGSARPANRSLPSTNL